MKITALKSKLPVLLHDFLRVSLCFLPVIPVIRLMEFLLLRSVHNLPAGSGGLIFSGMIPDLFCWLVICLLSIVPYLLVGLLSRKTASMIWLIMTIFYSFLHFGLISYFSITLVPLDQVVFSYSLKEMMTISASSAKFSFLTFLPFLVLTIAILVSWFLMRKVKAGKRFMLAALVVLLLSPLFLKLLNPKPDRYTTDFDYYLAVNKPLYLFGKCWSFLHAGSILPVYSATPDAAMKEQFSLYHANHPEFRFIGGDNPLLHFDDTPDVLSPYFQTGEQKPNFVFIIVESLSSAFCGDQPYLGSFTPFIDSLSHHSLYWKNCLTSSERTFYMLPALFGSLPYGAGKYLDNLTGSAYHLSLIRYLNQNGYTSRFFYGGDPAFNQMDNFLRRNEIGFILTTWGPSYNRQSKASSGFTWGYPDHEMFRRSFEVIDSMQTKPSLDIFLTLSTHAPFEPPMREKCLAMYEKRLNELKMGKNERKEAEKYKDIYSTILYSDDALRSFFKEYRKRSDFNNTIFIITGDHSLPELNIGWYSPMERFRVPFIIYSPMLKKAHEFQSVITHLDVTPSILSMMRNKFGIRTQPLAHWLGTGLDTTTAFRSTKSLVCIRNNKDMVDFIDGNYCLSDGRLFRITPEMKAEPLKDQVIQTKLQNKLHNFVQVTEYVGSTNTLIPVRMMFGKDLTGQEIPVNDQIRYSGESWNEEFISLLPQRDIKNDYKYITISISFKFFSSETDPEKLPKLVFDVSDEKGKNLVWNQYPLFKPGEYHPGQWQTVTFNGSMDLSSVKYPEACNLKMFLWNSSKITVRGDSLSKSMKGFL